MLFRSQFPLRYNQFSITEKIGANSLNGEVTLGNEGLYNYVIYQTSLANTVGLTKAEDAEPFIIRDVEYGVCWVIPTQAEVDTYEPATTTAIVYEG